MKLIDSHCHINDVQFNKDLDEVVSRAVDTGISQMICVGTDIKSSERAIEIANKYPNIYLGFSKIQKVWETRTRINVERVRTSPRLTEPGKSENFYF